MCDYTDSGITESLNSGTTLQEYDDLNQCTLSITDSEFSFSSVTTPPAALSSCMTCSGSITAMEAFLDHTDTVPVQFVSPYHSLPGTASENFWQYSGGWKFDGLLDSSQSSNRQRTDLSFYIRATITGGSTYWLGGTGSETQFKLFCDIC